MCWFPTILSLPVINTQTLQANMVITDHVLYDLQGNLKIQTRADPGWIPDLLQSRVVALTCWTVRLIAIFAERGFCMHYSKDPVQYLQVRHSPLRAVRPTMYAVASRQRAVHQDHTCIALVQTWTLILCVTCADVAWLTRCVVSVVWRYTRQRSSSGPLAAWQACIQYPGADSMETAMLLQPHITVCLHVW